MAAKKKPSKKAPGQKGTKKKPSAKKAAAKGGAGLVESTGPCRQCVIAAIRNLSGREPDAGDTLNDLFDECDAAVIQALRNAFSQCPNANANAPFSCATTVGTLLLRVCG